MANSNFTYTLKLENRSTPSIKATFENITAESLSTMIFYGERAFRDVEVVNEQTGEIEYTHYYSDNMFNQLYTCGEALSILANFIQC